MSVVPARPLSEPSKRIEFDVLMSVYHGEKPHHLRESLRSLCTQTRTPHCVVLVQDGPLGPELEAVIEEFRTRLPLICPRLQTNQGLPQALNHGLGYCPSEWVARFDSDDVCVPDRFELQCSAIENHSAVDVLGGQIDEFDENLNLKVGSRYLPTDPIVLKRFSKYRNPLNHMTVMFRRSAVQAAGGYPSIQYFEDYALWLVLLRSGRWIENLDTVLVKARAGSQMLGRRSGAKYAWAEIRFLSKMWGNGLMDAGGFLINVLTRIPIRLLPMPFVKAAYQLLRTR